MSMAGGDITIEILKDIRDEIRGVRGEQVETNKRLEVVNERLDASIQRLDVIGERLDVTNQRVDVTNQRLDTVESTLLDLAQQQRFVVRYTKATAERDFHL